MIERDLLGHRIVTPTPGRRRFGYADRPGTGPKGQRCNTCKFCILVCSTNRVRKCEVMARRWDIPGSEIKPNAPACSHWSRRLYQPLSR